MRPVLNPGTVVFSSVPHGTAVAGLEPIATLRETEGLSLVLEEAVARAAGLPVLLRAAWITLSVNSALEAIGLTAAVATALADAGISCNVVAGALHDHLFVPVERATEAVAVLDGLAREAG